MPFFLGNQGSIRLRRAVKYPYGRLEDSVGPDDVTLILNRFSFENALDNLLIGDRIDIVTDDPRGLAFLAPTAWPSGERQSSISAYIHVNAMGGLRLFPDFQSAVNNNRENELSMADFTGDPIQIGIVLRDTAFNVLGDVQSYQFYSDRESIDTTTLSDKFKQQYSAGLISGSGSIDCLFNYKTAGFKETPLLLLQLVQRIDVGSEFDLALYLTDQEINPNVDSIFYDVHAMVTRAGVQVTAGDLVKCSIDFVSTGEVRLLYGKPAEYILKEDDDRIELEHSLDFLLKEVTD